MTTKSRTVQMPPPPNPPTHVPDHLKDPYEAYCEGYRAGWRESGYVCYFEGYLDGWSDREAGYSLDLEDFDTAAGDDVWQDPDEGDG